MAAGREYSHSQSKIIDRYYQQSDTILAQRLGEIVTDLALAAGDQKKLDSLWKRAEQALAKTDLKPAAINKAVEPRDVEALARLVAKLAV